MKKNRMMRAASALLVAVLLTTCTISGTFAKYVTSASASDTATVAKWGVEITAAGDLFYDAYSDVGTTNSKTTWTDDESVATITVQSATELSEVVAPGTNGGDGLTFTITGKPEVDTKLTIAVTGAIPAGGTERATTATDIVLPGDTYDDPTLVTYTDGTPAQEKFTVEDYHPLVFTLTQTIDGATNTLVDKKSLSAVESALEGLSTNASHTNDDLSKVYGTLNLTWEWPFVATDSTMVDTYNAADTLLGNIAAGKTTVTGASTTVDIQIDITVEQVD